MQLLQTRIFFEKYTFIQLMFSAYLDGQTGNYLLSVSVFHFFLNLMLLVFFTVRMSVFVPHCWIFSFCPSPPLQAAIVVIIIIVVNVRSRPLTIQKCTICFWETAFHYTTIFRTYSFILYIHIYLFIHISIYI